MVRFHPLPIANVVEPLNVGLDEVGSAVECAREVAREHNRTLLVWWVPPAVARLGGELEQLGLVNRGTPGFEAVENAMALVVPPLGKAPGGST